MDGTNRWDRRYFIILVGLAGKRYYYARLVADFTLTMKEKIISPFLYGKTVKRGDPVSS